MDRRVLVADLAGLDEFTQGARNLSGRSRRSCLAGAVAGNQQNSIERARAAAFRTLAAVQQLVTGQLQAAL